MRVAIYIRVSKAAGSQVPAEQLQLMRAMSKKQRWRIVRVYTDHISGKSTDRPAFRQMLEDAENRRFDLVLFWDLNRLSPEGALAAAPILERLHLSGIGFRSFTEDHLDSHKIFKDALISVLAPMEDQKRRWLSERTKAGLRRQRLTGTAGPHGWIGPGRPPVEIEGGIDRIQRLHYIEGKSLNEIAKICKVSKATIYRMLEAGKKKQTARDRHPARKKTNPLPRVKLRA